MCTDYSAFLLSIHSSAPSAYTLVQNSGDPCLTTNLMQFGFQVHRNNFSTRSLITNIGFSPVFQRISGLMTIERDGGNGQFLVFPAGKLGKVGCDSRNPGDEWYLTGRCWR